MKEEESKEFIRRVLADYEKTENMAESYRTIKATYPEGTKCPTYNGCVKAYERQLKQTAVQARREELAAQEAPAEERTITVQKIRMLNNIIESLTSVEWTDEQLFLKMIREDYLAELEK